MTRRRKIVVLIAGMLVTALPVTGCGGGSTAPSGARASTVIFDMDSGMPQSIVNFSPYSNNSNDGLIQAVYEPLFISNVKTGKLQPWLALSMTSNDAFDNWIIKLRPGVKWADGLNFTAADVVWTLDALKSGKLGAIGIPSLSNLASVTAEGPLTIDIKLASPDPRLDHNLFGTAVAGQPVIILPEHIWSKQSNPQTFSNFNLKDGWPIGTGPYKLSNVTPNTFTYTRRDDWWGVKAGFMSLPAPKELQWTAFGTESGQAAAMANNQLDEGEQFSTGTFLSLRAQDSQVHAWQDTPPYGAPDVCGYSLDFNTTKAPWDNPTLRWAVSYSINRKSLINTAFQGASQLNQSIFADYPIPNNYVDGLSGQGAVYAKQVAEFSPQEAARLFQELGYHKDSKGIYEKNGKELSLVITNYDSAPKDAVTAAVVEQLSQAGVAAVEDKNTTPNFVASELAGKFQANLFFGTCGTVDSILPSLETLNVSNYVPDGKNVASFYSNPFRWNTDNAKKYSSYVDKIAQLPPSDPKIQQLVDAAMPYFYKDLPSIPLLFNFQINLVSTKYWTGWPLAGSDYNWGYYLDPSLQLVLHQLKPSHP